MQKLYYTISEVAKIVGEPQYVLRYWEKEFPLLRPKKNRAGNRIYSEKDLEIVRAIKTMLREQKLSARGALEELYRLFDKPKKNLKKTSEDKPKVHIEPFSQAQTLFNASYESKIFLKEIRNTLMSILDEAKNL